MKCNSRIKITSSLFFFSLIIIFFNIIGYLFIESILTNKSVTYDNVSTATISALGIILIELIAFFIYCKKKVTNYLIFIISFIIFHFGLLIVYSIGWDYNFFYLQQYGAEVVVKTIQLGFIGTGALFIAGIFYNQIQPFKFKAINQLNETRVYSVAKMGWILTAIVAFVLLTGKTIAFIRGDYQGARDFDSSVSSLIGLFEYLYIPFSVLFLIYSNNKRENKICNILIIAWGMITALCGDRTSGLAALIIVFLIHVRFKKVNRKKQFIESFLLLLIILFLVPFIKYFREGNSFSFDGLVTVLSEFLGELGSSFFPIVLILRICPSSHDFLFGSSYFYSTIAAFIPESIDFTGLITQWNSKAIEPLNWISADYDYSFGTGYSLIAEAYANFAGFGWIFLVFIGFILIKLLKESNDNKFSKYTSTILMFEFFTLPRRNFYYVINHTFYCIVCISFILLILCQSKTEKKIIYENRI